MIENQSELFKDTFSKLKEGISNIVSSIGSFFTGGSKEKKKPNKNSQKGEHWDESPTENKVKTKKEKKNRSERFNVSDLPDERHQYEYFWRSLSVYSQWYACVFEVEEKRYNCAEQYMMHQKAGIIQVIFKHK